MSIYATTWTVHSAIETPWKTCTNGKMIISAKESQRTKKKKELLISSFLRRFHSFSNEFLHNCRLREGPLDAQMSESCKKKNTYDEWWTGIRNEVKRIKWAYAVSACHLMFFCWKYHTAWVTIVQTHTHTRTKHSPLKVASNFKVHRAVEKAGALFYL